MKRFVCFILAILLMAGMCACGKNTETPAPTEGIVRDPNMPKKLFAADLAAIPIATDDMTKAELRQLVLDYFALQLSFQWKPDMDFEFFKTYSGSGGLKEISKDNLYGGILYQSGGFGNLYRWLEYYDEETGVMPMSEALADNGGYGEGAAVTDVEATESGRVTYQKYRSMMALGNQCTSSSSWSWGRVINSVCFGDTCDINVYNGFIPVGCYTYSYEHEGVTYDALTIQDFGKEVPSNPIGYDTEDVIADWNAANGSDAMYKCYAQLKPADCVVSGGHAMMVKSVSLFTTSDGSVNYALSTVVVNEQIEGWGLKDNNVGGKKLFQQGAVDAIYTFEQLQKADYIPFTFPEFLDENDPQDKKYLDYYMSYADKLESRNARYQVFTDARGKCGNGVEKAETYCTYEGDTITYGDFAAMTVGSNYSISDVFVTVTDSSGKVLLKNIYRATYTNYREVSMSYGKHTWETDADGNRIPISDGVEALADGKNVIEVTMQLSTGELLTAYKGTLTK